MRRNEPVAKRDQMEVSNIDNKIIMSTETKNSKDYTIWLTELKQRYKSSQMKAAVKVNSEMLAFYWSLGRDLVEMKMEEKWGEGIVERISLDLKREYPEQKGFSTINLWYMKRWYLFYNQGDKKLYQAGKELEEMLFSVPWRHHCHIISKCKSVEEALFYVRQTIDGNWSRSTLENAVAAKRYESTGKAVTNFDTRLPKNDSDMAKDILKDPYNFDFLSMTDRYTERELENELTNHITKFLLELGTGFAFYGRQVELRVSGTSYYIDMLFYHVRLKCFVVVELKTVEFEPEFAGKLNFYVTAVDRLLKQENDRPTIGLLICKTKDKTKVEWSFDSVNKPMGVASYEMETLPTKEQLCKELDDTKEELKDTIKMIDNK